MPDWYEKLKEMCYNSKESTFFANDLHPGLDDEDDEEDEDLDLSFNYRNGWYEIANDAFDVGTLRITQPGCYKLVENIEFEPNGGCCDYWPRFDTSIREGYPMGPYALGFFSAVSIETSWVVFDLNGYEIRQSVEYNLKQRFFNIFQFGSRAFEKHDGMPSLNLQDKEPLVVQGKFKPVHASETRDTKHGGVFQGSDVMNDYPFEYCPKTEYRNEPNAVPSYVIVRNGALGLSSHNGIQGNGGPSHIVVEDLWVHDFEVAGIQFNGPKDLIIRNCQVGPSAYSRVLGTMSSARFLGFWYFFYWMKFWTPEEVSVLLDNNYITFADGRKENIGDIFKRLFLAEQLLTENLKGRHFDDVFPGFLSTQTNTDAGQIINEVEFLNDPFIADLAPENITRRNEVIKDAQRVLGNPAGRPDGSSLYGIIIHRRRKGVHKMGEEHWNFYGNEDDFDSAQHVRIWDVRVRGLKHRAVEVPAIGHGQGGILNGPSGEVIRISEMADYRGIFSMKSRARYRGNIHNDALVAFYKIAQDFWQYSVWGLNETVVYDDKYTCGNNPFTTPGGSPYSCPADIQLTVPKGPRAGCADGIMHKKFFGAITLSHKFYQWATEGLDDGLAELFDQSPDPAERKAHGHTILCGGDTMFHNNKGVFGLKVNFAHDVTVDNVDITDIDSDAERNNFFCDNRWRFSNGDLGPKQHEDYNGADVTGAVIAKSSNVFLSNVNIDQLSSKEGKVIGLDILGDVDGRAMYQYPTKDELEVKMTGVTIGNQLRGGYEAVAVRENTLGRLQAEGGLTTGELANTQHKWDPPLSSVTMLTSYFMARPTTMRQKEVDTILKNLGVNPIDFLSEAKGYFETYYGLKLDQATKLQITADYKSQRHTAHLVCKSGKCLSPKTLVQNVYISAPLRQGMVLQGTYADKVVTTQAPPNHEVRIGLWVVRTTSKEAPLVIRYYGTAPELDASVLLDYIKKERVKLKIVTYDVFNQKLGYGKAYGLTLYQYDKASAAIQTSGALRIIFDEDVRDVQEEYTPPLESKAIFRQYLTVSNVMTLDVVGDGQLISHDPVSSQTQPLTNLYFYTNEGAIKDWRRWLYSDLSSDFNNATNYATSQIFAYRDTFIGWLNKRFNAGIKYPLPAEADFIDQSFAGIEPYTMSTSTDLRIIQGVDRNGTVHRFGKGRLIEFGFKYSSPKGMIKKGYYIIENIYDTAGQGFPGLPEFLRPGQVAFEFETMIPSSVNDLNQVGLLEKVSALKVVDTNPASRKFKNVPIVGMYEATSIQSSDDQNVKPVYFQISGTFKLFAGAP